MDIETWGCEEKLVLNKVKMWFESVILVRSPCDWWDFKWQVIGKRNLPKVKTCIELCQASLRLIVSGTEIRYYWQKPMFHWRDTPVVGQKFIYHNLRPHNHVIVFENFEFLYFHPKIRPLNSISGTTVCALCVNFHTSVCTKCINFLWFAKKCIIIIIDSFRSPFHSMKNWNSVLTLRQKNGGHLVFCALYCDQGG